MTTSAASTAPLLEVKDLTTHIHLTSSVVQAVSEVSFSLKQGETLGLVGESGCGKSMTGLSLMRLLPPGGRLVQGSSIRLNGEELADASEDRMRTVRGNEIAMVFQDPMTSLDPTKTIGYQVAEPVRLHRGVSKREALDRAAEVLGLVGLPRPKERLGDYPHQLSGGLRQRVMIAMALACEPKVLIADEPTTALDVTIQAQILDLLADLKDRLGMAMILITHDMGVVAGHADRINVMYAGRIAETTDTRTLFAEMRHPYTQGLLGSIPRLDQDNTQRLFTVPGLPPDLSNPPAGCRFAARCSYATDRCREEEPRLDGPGSHQFACWHPVRGPLDLTGRTTAHDRPASATAAAAARANGAGEGEGGGAEGSGSGPRRLLEVRDLVKEFPVGGRGFRRDSSTVKAVSGVSLTLGPGETFGLVGESGCGKTTLGRLIVGLEKPNSGEVTVNGSRIGDLRGRALREHRRDLQMMFQDPYSSLDPRMRVGSILREPLRVQGIGSAKEQLDRAKELLDEVGLPSSALERFPHEFSGGQRQRIGLARALTLNPKLIVADEPVSALDVSIRAQVLNLMKRLQAAHDLSYVVISHDLAVVKYLADRIGVMYLGKLVELGSGEDIYQRPAHPYTAGLLKAIPIPEPEAEREKRGEGVEGELPSPINPPSGCRFRTRCPLAQDRCAEEVPELRLFSDGHQAACHFPLQTPAPESVAAGEATAAS
ncbi:ABC transporter ATP-binding protein [Phaeacidiphilus oryzae]|uniref:ABC transporter ATP-binding protein n=1 Tax=Phaeacidiphilus oryzae TaxID=348818 RepID=UPI000560F284|nr:ABC transporter ATP-binding protein [Phaeacidiphilus oryzae]